jgi:hypothetical protein
MISKSDLMKEIPKFEMMMKQLNIKTDFKGFTNYIKSMSDKELKKVVDIVINNYESKNNRKGKSKSKRRKSMRRLSSRRGGGPVDSNYLGIGISIATVIAFLYIMWVNRVDEPRSNLEWIRAQRSARRFRNEALERWANTNSDEEEEDWDSELLVNNTYPNSPTQNDYIDPRTRFG